LNSVLKSGAGAATEPQRERVDQQPQHALTAFAALHAAEQDGSEHHVVTAGKGAEHLRPCEVAQSGRTHTERSGLLAQTRRKRPFERAPRFHDSRTVAADIGQAEGSGRLGDVAQHVAEERFVFFTAHAETRLRDEVSERQRPRQLRRCTAKVRLDLPEDHFQRRVIADEMVVQQHCGPTIAACIMRNGHVEQRRPPHVETVAARIETHRKLFGDIAVGAIEDELLNR
jgi:hypothetical protein